MRKIQDELIAYLGGVFKKTFLAICSKDRIDEIGIAKELIKKLTEDFGYSPDEAKALLNELFSEVMPFYFVDDRIKMYEAESNPLFLWQAMEICILCGLEIPRQALEYLLRTSRDLQDLAFSKKEDGGHLGGQLLEALGFINGKGFTSKAVSDDDFSVFSLKRIIRNNKELQKEKLPKEDDFEYIARSYPDIAASGSTAKRKYYGMRKLFERIVTE